MRPRVPLALDELRALARDLPEPGNSHRRPLGADRDGEPRVEHIDLVRWTATC